MHYTAVGLGSVATALSVSGVATSLTGPGVIIGVPLGGIAALFGAASATLAETSQKLGHKTSKLFNSGSCFQGFERQLQIANFNL